MPGILGIDAGEERTGLAISDDAGRIAVPLTIIERRARTLDRVAAEIAQRAHTEEVSAIVVGLPLNMDGSEGPQARRARSLGKRIAAATGLPIHYQDERMSSFIVEERLRRTDTFGLPWRRMKKHGIDDLAAAVILQAFLDSRAGATA